MTETLLSHSDEHPSFSIIPVRKEIALLEDFVMSAYNKIIINGNVVTRRRRPHRQGYMTNYYLNGSRVSLNTLRAFFGKSLPELTQYQVELNLLCGSLRTEVVANRLPRRDKSDRSWSTGAIIDRDHVTKIVDITYGNKVTYKLNGRKIALSSLKEHFAYGPLFEEVHDYTLSANRMTKVNDSEVIEPEVEVAANDEDQSPSRSKWRAMQLPGFWKMVEYVAPYVACAGIFMLMGKMYH